MNFVKFLRTPFYTEKLRWLLLKQIFTEYLWNKGQSKKKKERTGEKRRNFLLVTRYSLHFTRYSLLFTRYSLLFTRYSLLFTRSLLLFTRYSLIFTRYSLLVAFYSLRFATYLLLVATYSALITFYSLSTALYSKLDIRQFLKKKIQALMHTFLWSVDIVCHHVDLIVLR